MTTRPQKPEGHDNLVLVDFDPNPRSGSGDQSAPQDQSQSANSPPDRMVPSQWLIATAIAALVLGVVALALFVSKDATGQQLEDIELQLAESETSAVIQGSELRDTKGQLADEMTNRFAVEGQLSDTQLELARANQLAAERIDPDVHDAVLESEAQLTDELSQKDIELAQQTEIAEQQKVEIELGEDAISRLQVDLEAVRVEAFRADAAQNAEGVRAADALAQLSTAHDMAAVRAEAALRVLNGVPFGSKVYNLGEVRFHLVRSYFVWNDETQIFTGTGEIRFDSRLSKAQIKLLDDQTIQAILPLPGVEDAEHVVLDGTRRTEREQAARIGARWGEQTEVLVDAKAKNETRSLACQDVAALRYEMSRLMQLTNHLTNGYKLDVRWIDSNGVMRTSVTDEQLLANAC